MSTIRAWMCWVPRQMSCCMVCPVHTSWVLWHCMEIQYWECFLCCNHSIFFWGWIESLRGVKPGYLAYMATWLLWACLFHLRKLGLHASYLYVITSNLHVITNKPGWWEIPVIYILSWSTSGLVIVYLQHQHEWKIHGKAKWQAAVPC